MKPTGEERCAELTELDYAPQQSTGVAVTVDELQHPAKDAAVTAAEKTPQTLNASKCAPRGSGWNSVGRHFRAEVMKILRLQIDCGLYNNDWRLVYGGSSLVCLHPCALLVVRAAAVIGHLTALIFENFYNELLFFTTWTNLISLVAFFLSTVTSIVAVCSLSDQGRLAETDGGLDPCAKAAPRRGLLSFFHDVATAYRQLLKQRAELSCMGSPSDSKDLQLRGCCAFRRPFSGSPRRPALEALLCSHDIAWSFALPMNTVMFLVYWILLYPQGSHSRLWTTVYLHLCCPIATWLLALLSRAPYRLSLLPLGILLGVFYSVLIAILQCFGIGFLYWFLNFQKRPALACGMSGCTVFVLTPLTACLAFLVLHRNYLGVFPANK
ncbi:uncharacterized protein EMH_0064450 [Eimeria mitis]|uniref:Transmembrane protein n=1 Tax=Eimeria mitis TaxID=44415 RepID=U6KIN8_9EIME|nr:uncharacterized protein EMH_0064450 [Eimeria mitis]CDJ36132.1 hypothetical protein, conserved [Eimeria mitis]